MKGSRKDDAPVELSNWLNMETDEWKPEYTGMPREVKQSIQNSMYKDQRGLCVYCGRRLNLDKPGKSFHIEHFRPQHDYPEQDVCYENLFLSCGQEDPNGLPAPTCGTVKGGWFAEDKHVYPAYSDCTDRFRFLLTGDIVPAQDDDDAAKEMISRLKLDHPELKKERETVLFLIDGGEVTVNDYWDAATGTAEGYAHVAYQYQNGKIP